jgi:hypothetical protein
MGSMTSPPCAENVVWFIYEKPIGQGSTVLSMLRDALNPPGKTPHDKQPNYDGSNREIQKTRNRSVFFYDKLKGCTPFRDDTSQYTGHWEKLATTQETYMLVGSLKPSGVPNAQVVSPSEANEPIIDQTRKSDRYQLNAPP